MQNVISVSHLDLPFCMHKQMKDHSFIHLLKWKSIHAAVIYPKQAIIYSLR